MSNRENSVYGFVYNKEKKGFVDFHTTTSNLLGTFGDGQDVININGVNYRRKDFRSINIKNCNIEHIPDNMFSHFFNLKKIVLPTCLKEIGSYSFLDCKKLKSINIPKTVTKVGTRAFYNCLKMLKITIPCSLLDMWKENEVDWVLEDDIVSSDIDIDKETEYILLCDNTEITLK